MKTPPLPEIDLARITVLPEDQQRCALLQMKRGRPPYSYQPTRSVLPDILNVEIGSLGRSKLTEWSIISGLVARRSKTPEENTANQYVARALYDFSFTKSLRGRQVDFYPLAIGLSAKVSYWSKAVVSWDDKACVPFIDPRKTKGLTREARRFVFSVMHERIRVADPDFAGVHFVIFQFGRGDAEDNARPIVLNVEGESSLFGFEQIDQMVRVTYRLWEEVLRGREEEKRRKAGGSIGGLFG